MTPSRPVRWLLPMLMGLGAFLILQSRTAAIGLGDPDRYFHLGLARETSAAGKLWLSKLPQFTGLGWERQFPDKEFLFHLVNRGLYAVGGESAVLQVIPIASSLIVLSLFGLLAGQAGVWLGTAILIAGLVLDPYLMVRLGMLRPHLLAILWFTLLLHALVRGRAGLAFTAGLLYSWSYHSFYVPLIVLGAYWAVTLELKGRRFRLVVWGGIGLMTGLIANPHFPGNLLMGFRHLIIALFEAGKTKLDFGMELFPWSTDRFIRLYLPFLYLIVISSFLSGQSGGFKRITQKDSHFGWVWISTLIFFALSALNPRGIEYAVPLGLLLFSITLRDLVLTKRHRIIFVVALVVCSVPRMMQVAASYTEIPGKGNRVDGLLEALKKVPNKKAHFYNVEWDASPYIYYSHPEMQTVDLLDPSFLETQDPRHHSVRWALRQGEVPDPWGVIQSLSGSRYLLTRYPGLRDQLNADVHFTRLTLSGEDAIYQLQESRLPNFVLSWRGALVLKSGKPSEADVLTPALHPEFKKVASHHEHQARERLGFEIPKIPSAYLDLRFGEPPGVLGLATGHEFKKISGEGVSCILVEPAPSERERQAGKSVIVLGGGRSLRVWLNGRPFFRSIAVTDSVSLMDRLVPVGRKLTAADRLELLVCSKDSAKSLGLALSFWTPEEITASCKDRGWKEAEALSLKSGWAHTGEYRETCFGNYVR